MKNKKTDIKFIIISVITAILAIAVIAMGVLLHVMYNNISLLGNKITYLSDSAEIMITNVDNLQSNIEATLEEENSLLESWDITLVDTDFKKKKYTLDVVIIPKEFTDNTSISMYFGTEEFVLPKNDFSYEALITLPMGESYEKKVTVLITDGKKKSTEILRGYKDVQHDFDNVLSGNATTMPEYKDGQLTIKGALDFALKGDSEFEFTDFQLVLTENGEEIWNGNLKEMYQLQDPDSTEEEEEPDDGSLNDDIIEGKLTVDEQTTSMASVNTEEPLSQEEIIATTITELAGTYHMNKTIEVSEGADVRLFLRAVSEDGFTFEYDLFNGKTNVSVESTETEEETEEENTNNGFEESENYFAGYYSVYDKKGAKYEEN